MVIGTSRCAHVLRYLFSDWWKSSSTTVVSGEPEMRNARPIARRRSATSRHCGSGCNHAPRPGRLPAVSTVTAQAPGLSETVDSLTRSTANARFRQPTHVRTGPAGSRCARGWPAGVSRWITVQSTVPGRPDFNRVSLRPEPASLRGVFCAVGIGRGGRIAADIDAPSGQPSGEPGVLPLLADGQ